jgi:hypothetical protein
MPRHDIFGRRCLARRRRCPPMAPPRRWRRLSRASSPPRRTLRRWATRSGPSGPRAGTEMSRAPAGGRRVAGACMVGKVRRMKPMDDEHTGRSVVLRWKPLTALARGGNWRRPTPLCEPGFARAPLDSAATPREETQPPAIGAADSPLRVNVGGRRVFRVVDDDEADGPPRALRQDARSESAGARCARVPSVAR